MRHHVPRIADLRNLDIRLELACGCGRKVVWTLDEAEQRLGPNTTITAAENMLRCTECLVRGEIRLRPLVTRRPTAPRPLPSPEDATAPRRSPVKRHKPGRPIVMAWQSTMAAMIAHGTYLSAFCDGCPRHWKLDPAVMAEVIGPDGDLWDRWGVCVAADCGGRVFFHAGPGPSTPSRPMITPGVLDHWIGEAVDWARAIRPEAAP